MVFVLFLDAFAEVRCGGAIITVAYLLVYFICIMIWAGDFREKQVSHESLKVFLFSAASLCIYIIMLTMKYAPLKKILSGVVRMGEDSYFLSEQVFVTGANGLGMICVFSTAVSIVLITRKDINKTYAFCL